MALTGSWGTSPYWGLDTKDQSGTSTGGLQPISGYRFEPPAWTRDDQYSTNWVNPYAGRQRIDWSPLAPEESAGTFLEKLSGSYAGPTGTATADEKAAAQGQAWSDYMAYLTNRLMSYFDPGAWRVAAGQVNNRLDPTRQHYDTVGGAGRDRGIFGDRMANAAQKWVGMQNAYDQATSSLFTGTAPDQNAALQDVDRWLRNVMSTAQAMGDKRASDYYNPYAEMDRLSAWRTLEAQLPMAGLDENSAMSLKALGQQMFGVPGSAFGAPNRGRVGQFNLAALGGFQRR